MPDSHGFLNLLEPRRIHVVGAGGAGMSAIAAVLSWMGHRVSGSDLKDSSSLERLRALGLDVRVGHRRENVGDVDLVTVSTAIPATNAEVVCATERSIPVLSRAEMLRAISAVKRTVAVAGTHGKTTTSSMLSLILMEAGVRPSFIIGGDVNEIGSGAVWDTGDLFVVEADESDGTFLTLSRAAAVVTNVEPDHLEHWGGFANLDAAFDRFVSETSGPVVCCADDSAAAELAARHGAVTYGTDAAATYRMESVVRRGVGTSFDLVKQGANLASFEVPVPGLHNARNAAGAAAIAIELGVEPAAARRALGRFGGVARRFEPRGSAGGISFVDDYAHLPTEVEAALSAARDGDWTRVVCVFQPHRYSRTQALWQDFASAFSGADLLVVTDVYASNEPPRPGVTGKLVLDAVLDARPDQRVAWLPHHDDVVTFLLSELRPGDLCLTLGAGDLTLLPDQILAGLRLRAAA